MLYNSYNDDALLSLISNTFQLKSIKLSADLSSYFTTFNSYIDQLYDLETLEKTLVICKSLIQQQRANNLIKYLNDKFNLATNGQTHFINALNDLFWRVINRHLLSLNQIGQADTISNLNMIVETLIEIMHVYLMVELTAVHEKNAQLETFSNSTILNIVFECYMKLLCNDLLLDINFVSRRTLLNLLKLPTNSSKSKTNLTATPSKAASAPSKLKFINAPSSAAPQPSLTISELTNEPVSISQRPTTEETPQESLNPNLNQIEENFENNDLPSLLEDQGMDTNQEQNNIAQYFFNEDEEMLQLAMALSLNEAEAAAAAASNPSVNLQRTSTSSTNNLSAPIPSKTSSKLKNPVYDDQDQQESKPVINLGQVVYPTAAYLTNTNVKLQQLRKILLEKFSQNIELSILETHSRKEKPSLENSGLRLIAFFQCILNLLSDLNAQDEQDRKLLENIIHSLLEILKPFKTLANKLSGVNEMAGITAAVDANNQSEPPVYVRTEKTELQLVSLTYHLFKYF